MLHIYGQHTENNNQNKVYIVGDKESLHLLAMKLIEAINYSNSTASFCDSSGDGYPVVTIHLEDQSKWALLLSPTDINEDYTGVGYPSDLL